MMGDREKCIQAQMDEYLSKPLQQNHLIQTILKCATLGGQLLEKNRERELATIEGGTPPSPTETTDALARPALESRAFTSKEPIMGPSLDSPALVTSEQDDPISRARTYPEMRSLSGPAP